MPLVKCKCGGWTNNGLLCSSCQYDLSFDFTYDIDNELEKEYAKAGMSVVDEDYFDEVDEDDE